MIKQLFETIKARILRGERRVAPLNQLGRVYASKNKGQLGGSNRMLGNAKFKLDMKITRADGTVEHITRESKGK